LVSLTDVGEIGPKSQFTSVQFVANHLNFEVWFYKLDFLNNPPPPKKPKDSDDQVNGDHSPFFIHLSEKMFKKFFPIQNAKRHHPTEIKLYQNFDWKYYE